MLEFLGDRWPRAGERVDMLTEAVEIIRKLWRGESVSHRGRHYTVSNARVYTLPPQPTKIIIAAKGKRALTLAGREGDGLIGTAPDRDTRGSSDSTSRASCQNCAEA